MVYHSSMNDRPDVQTVCGCMMLPIKTTTRGPAPLAADGLSVRLTLRSRASTPLEPIVRLAGEDDIIDEVIGFFKANVLFKHFEVKGGADRILIYLTLYITQCLQRLEKCPSPTDGMKALTAMAHESFRIPGDAGFALGSFFPSPASSQEAELCRGYLKQLREEIGRRLVSRVYSPEGQPSKFWLVFAKRKFMNKTL